NWQEISIAEIELKHSHSPIHYLKLKLKEAVKFSQFKDETGERISVIFGDKYGKIIRLEYFVRYSPKERNTLCTLLRDYLEDKVGDLFYIHFFKVNLIGEKDYSFGATRDEKFK